MKFSESDQAKEKAKQQASDIAIVRLPSVRLSFPHLFTAHAMEGSEPKFSCTFLMNEKDPQHFKLIQDIDVLIRRLALDHFKKNVQFKSCLREGSDKPDVDGYGDDIKFITASRKTRPAVVDRDPSIPLTEADGKLYAGCYVNGSIRLWVQDNKWGKRVNAELRAVQFVKDGESFGAGPVDAEKEFDEVKDAEDKSFD